MISIRQLTIIAAFLIIAIYLPESFISQTPSRPSRPGPPSPGQRQTRRTQRSDGMAQAINDLLNLDPLSPGYEPEYDSSTSSPEEEEKPPADDAPISKLINYWTERNADPKPNAKKPSDKVSLRLLEEIEKHPERMIQIINFLPESTDTHDRLYKLLEEETDGDDVYWKSFLWIWLARHSRYFRDDLIEDARNSVEAGAEENLTSLARLDWETAKPILENLAATGTPERTPIALSLLYEHSQKDGDSTKSETYRGMLKAIVANRQISNIARQTALTSLISSEWSGLEDWVVSLFADPSLNNLDDDENPKAENKQEVKADAESGKHRLLEERLDIGVLSSSLDLNDEKWFSAVSNLIGANDHTVHRSAVRCLVRFIDENSSDKKKLQEAAQKLSPCLTDPDWATPEDRFAFIQSLVELKAPEFISGLIWVLDHDQDNENRANAANALIEYRDPRANPALRRALDKEEDEGNREKIVTALVECGGFSEDELVAAIEAYARNEAQSGIDGKIMLPGGDSDEPIPLKISIGRIMSDSDTIEISEGLAIKLFERAKALRSTRPAVARQILRAVERSQSPVVEVNLVGRIGEGWADIDTLLLAIPYRESLQKSAGRELNDLTRQGGYAWGIAATILNEERERREILKGIDWKAQRALLASARYMRDRLPVDDVGKLLEAPNRALAKAAESYLEFEDSLEARKLILAKHRNEAYILGDISVFNRNQTAQWEDAMRKEIKSVAGLEAIYAMANPYPNGIPRGVIIRVRDGRAEISVYEVEGRRNVRTLTGSEFEDLKSFTSRPEIEDLGPESYDNNISQFFEYLRLTKDGGRRIILEGLRRTPNNPTLHQELSGLFHRLSKSGEFVTRYSIEDKIPGVEVLLSDKKQEALMVCGEGSDIRVLIGEKRALKRLGLFEIATEWREFTSGRLGKVTGAPAACGLFSEYPALVKNMGDDFYSVFNQSIRPGRVWIYSTFGDNAGVWKREFGTEPVKIVSGNYLLPVVTPDGKWMVAIKAKIGIVETSNQLVRYNLETGKEYQVKMADDSFIAPLVYVASHGKVLIGHRGSRGEPASVGANYLLDVETGTLQPVKGEFRPLSESIGRELQPTGNPNEFWAAIHDMNNRGTTLGRYDSRNFAFKSMVETPELSLSSSNFWVDDGSGKIWITYRGHLLRIPLPTKTK